MINLLDSKDVEEKIELIMQEEIEIKKAILLTSESSLSKDWSRPNKDSAWTDL